VDKKNQPCNETLYREVLKNKTAADTANDTETATANDTETVRRELTISEKAKTIEEYKE